jgi:hypothetical protein
MDWMRLTRDTGTATLIQFITLGILNLVTGLNSIITACHHGKDCMTQAAVTPVYYILLTAWFASLWVLGYYTRERRSRWLAFFLFSAEGLVALISLFNAKHHTDLIGLITSLVDLALAIWIMILSFRLWLAGPGRISRSHGTRQGSTRPRQRRKTT